MSPETPPLCPYVLCRRPMEEVEPYDEDGMALYRCPKCWETRVVFRPEPPDAERPQEGTWLPR